MTGFFKLIGGLFLAILLLALIGSYRREPDEQPERQTDSAAASDWQEELERRQAAIERTSGAVQQSQQSPTRQPRVFRRPVPVVTDWQMINFVNEFGEQTDQGAVSKSARPQRPMSFPYGDTTARIFVNCDRAWVRFSNEPNLTGGDIADGYTSFTVTVRVDSNDARWRINQSWGGDDLRFTNSSGAVAALRGGSTFAIALPWYGERSVVFSWSLAGSSDAIQRSCD